MSPSVRDLIRAAQSAELRGDLSGAIEKLQSAAAVYEESGHLARAIQMLRHARRLAPDHLEVRLTIERLESVTLGPEAVTLPGFDATPTQPLLPSAELDEAAEEALTAIEAAEELGREHLGHVGPGFAPVTAELVEENQQQKGAGADNPSRADEIAEALESELAQEVESAFEAKLAQLEASAGRSPPSSEVDAMAETGAEPVEETAAAGAEADAAPEGEVGELPDDVAERLRKSAARTVESRRPRTVNLKMWFNPENPSEDGAVDGDEEPRSSSEVLEEVEEALEQMQTSPAVRASEARAVQEPEPESGSGSEPVPALERAERADRLENVRVSRPQRTVERGPTRAAAADAWCSFCCRPKGEVGELVTGPTGSFICRECVRESTKFFQLPEPSSSVAAQSWEASGSPDPGTDTGDLVGHEVARGLVERAVGSGHALSLVLGPSGTGKSRFLRELAKRPHAGVVLIDATGQSHEAAASELERVRSLLAEGKRIVLALTAAPPTPVLTLKADARQAQVFGSAALVKVTEGRLPIDLAERAQTVAVFAPLGEGELELLAARWVAARDPEVSIPGPALKALVKSAQASGRGAHELRALIRRLPVGQWEPPKPAKMAKPSKALKKPAARPSVKRRR